MSRVDEALKRFLSMRPGEVEGQDKLRDLSERPGLTPFPPADVFVSPWQFAPADEAPGTSAGTSGLDPALAESLIPAVIVADDLDSGPCRCGLDCPFRMDLWSPGTESPGYPPKIDCTAFVAPAGSARIAPTADLDKAGANLAADTATGDEMERVKRLSLKGGVLVARFSNGGPPGAWAVTSVIEAMRGELRSSDLLGQLPTGEITALLVRASADGVMSVAWRVRERLEELARDRQLPPIELGHTLYPDGGAESLSALVERARPTTQIRTSLALLP